MIMTRPEDSSITFTKHVWLITPSDGDQFDIATQSSYDDTNIFRCDIQKCNNFKKRQIWPRLFHKNVSQTWEQERVTTGRCPSDSEWPRLLDSPAQWGALTQPHPAFLSTVHSLALSSQLEQVIPVISFVMRFLWLVGNDRTVFVWVLCHLMTQSQIYRTKNNEPDSNTTMYFRLRVREEERWIIMMNNLARQSCETVLHVIYSTRGRGTLWSGRTVSTRPCNSGQDTAFATTSARTVLSPASWRPSHTLAFCRLRNLSQPLSNPSHPTQWSIPQKH
jgi:hypothetical protein